MDNVDIEFSTEGMREIVKLAIKASWVQRFKVYIGKIMTDMFELQI